MHRNREITSIKSELVIVGGEGGREGREEGGEKEGGRGEGGGGKVFV